MGSIPTTPDTIRRNSCQPDEYCNEKEKIRKDKITTELKDKYRSENEFAFFFKLLFSELKRKQYVFMKGDKKIGVRVPHINASESMSLFTISPEAIELKEIGK